MLAQIGSEGRFENPFCWCTSCVGSQIRRVASERRSVQFGRLMKCSLSESFHLCRIHSESSLFTETCQLIVHYIKLNPQKIVPFLPTQQRFSRWKWCNLLNNWTIMLILFRCHHKAMFTSLSFFGRETLAKIWIFMDYCFWICCNASAFSLMNLN